MAPAATGCVAVTGALLAATGSVVATASALELTSPSRHFTTAATAAATAALTPGALPPPEPATASRGPGGVAGGSLPTLLDACTGGTAACGAGTVAAPPGGGGAFSSATGVSGGLVGGDPGRPLRRRVVGPAVAGREGGKSGAASGMRRPSRPSIVSGTAGLGAWWLSRFALRCRCRCFRAATAAVPAAPSKAWDQVLSNSGVGSSSANPYDLLPSESAEPPLSAAAAVVLNAAPYAHVYTPRVLSNATMRSRRADMKSTVALTGLPGGTHASDSCNSSAHCEGRQAGKSRAHAGRHKPRPTARKMQQS